MTESARASSSKDVIDLTDDTVSDVRRVDQRPETAIIWAFLWRFAPLQEDILWPQSIEEFEVALLATSEPPEFGVDSKTPYVPSLVPILEWAAEISQLKAKSEKDWRHWLKSWTLARLKAAECKLSQKWSGENRLDKAGSFWSLPWQDKLILLKAMTDALLTYVEPIRDEISNKYKIVPNKDLIRTPKDNPLIVPRLGKDQNLRTYWHLDDSAYIWQSGNPYKLHCPLWTRTRNVDEVQTLVSTLHQPATKQDVAPIFKTQKRNNDPLAEEHALRTHLEKVIVPSLAKGTERMAQTQKAREEKKRAIEREQLREIRLQQQEALEQARNEDRKARSRARNLKDYHYYESEDWSNKRNTRQRNSRDVEDEDSDMSHHSKRRRDDSTEKDDGTFYLDDPELLFARTTRRQTRTASPADPFERRSGRHAAQPTNNGFHVADTEWSRSTRSRGGNATGQLPRGADMNDYNLLSMEDTIVWKGKMSRVVKGSLTAAAEVAQQLAEDAHERVRSLEHGRDKPFLHLPPFPTGANEAEYTDEIEDSEVWSRGHLKVLKGRLSAAREVAAQLHDEAERLVEIAKTCGTAPGHAPTIETSKTRKMDVFGRDFDSDAYTDEASSSVQGGEEENDASESSKSERGAFSAGRDASEEAVEAVASESQDGMEE